MVRGPPLAGLAGLLTGENRRVLATVAVIALLGLAGCVGDDDAAPDGDAPEYVPENVDVLASVDLQMVTADEVRQLQDGINEIWMAEVGEPLFPGDVDDFLDMFEEETGLDYADARMVTVFSEEPDDPTIEDEVGVILESGWAHEALAAAVSEDEPYDLELTEYHGEMVLYVPDDEPAFGEPVYLGVLPGDLVVIGDENSVTASLDVAYDDAPSLTGPLLDMYESMSHDGVAMAFDFAALIDEDDFPDEVPDDELDPAVFEQVEAAGVALYFADGSIALDTLFEAASAADADDLEAQLSGALELAIGELEQDDATADLAEELASIEISVDGTTVEIAYGITIDDLLDHIESYLELMFGGGGEFSSVSGATPGPTGPASA